MIMTTSKIKGDQIVADNIYENQKALLHAMIKSPHPKNGNYQLFWNTSYPTSFLAVHSHKMELMLMLMHKGAEVFDKKCMVIAEGIHHSYYPLKMKKHQNHTSYHSLLSSSLP